MAVQGLLHAAHKALHVCVDDQLLYKNLYFARCVYTSFTVICSEKSTPSVFYVYNSSVLYVPIVLYNIRQVVFCL